MSKLCFAALAAIVLGAVSLQAEEKAQAAGEAKRVKARAELIKEFDKDGDGKLNEQERAAMREQMRKNREKKFDTNGDGKLDETEKAAMDAARKAREKEFDKDGDGKLNEEERQAMRKALSKGRAGKQSKDK